ncbi:uncharacterized protein EV422DRAFT_568383 [Fimicolochytrium jonesii]|uniref:uncharacterized protein n=1 Tax=Fimicolochytrium jonesii TaxID=1396493 RepID=UPI0022FE4997|nr:uncharacterized protein EV422DRAFT_568383 [Fimicolochytrium jonesii]KAI8819932.1 hypothetical protein EV422DRAFT_568383 [Fimicolochytrium jonesii]
MSPSNKPHPNPSQKIRTEEPISTMKVLVTGATGFLGQHLTSTLLTQGLTHPFPSQLPSPPARHIPPTDLQVIAIGRNEVKGRKLREMGAVFVGVNLGGEAGEVEEVLGEVMEGVEVVFHCAAKCELAGRWKDFVSANITATQHIVSACITHAVPLLVHVSTPSIYTCPRDQLSIKEEDVVSLSQQINYYAKSKLMAEHIIHAALQPTPGHPHLKAAVILRPRGITGPNDTTWLPRLVSRIQSGRIPVINNGKGWMDVTYVGNVIDAMACVATVGDHVVNGHTYNISNDSPLQMHSLLAHLATHLSAHPTPIPLPFWAAYFLGYLSEIIWEGFGIAGEPTLSRYVACVMGKSLTLDVRRLREEVGWKPRVSVEEALKLTLESLGV